MTSYDGTVYEVITQLGARAHASVVIDATAHAIASCARMHVAVPMGVLSERLPDLANAGLRSLGMSVAHSAAGWVVSQSGRAPFVRECAGHGFASAPDPLSPFMPVAPPMPFANGDAGADLANFRDGVTARSDSQFELTRAAHEQLFGNIEQLAAQVRVIPAMTNGLATGVRLFGVRSNSVIAALGFLNGDEVRLINGVDITTPERALEAYSRLRNSDDVVVDIVRRGMPLEMHYHVAQ